MNEKIKIKELKEMIQVVLLRIPREIEAKEFYLVAAQKTSSEAAKDLFYSLAEQEQGHEAELRRVLKQLQHELKSLRQHK